VSRRDWADKQDGETLGRILELLAVADISAEAWRSVRHPLVAAWPARQDVADWAQPLGDSQVAPVEADVDVPEV
jgi:hypothetical protein